MSTLRVDTLVDIAGTVSVPIISLLTSTTLSGTTGASLVGTSSGVSVQAALNGKLSTSNALSEIAAAGAAAQIQAQTNLGIFSAMPVGMPMPWPLATPPQGWIMCNGQSFSTTSCPHLAIAYPSGNVPDLRGEFIRGWDAGRNADSGRTLLSWQQDAMRNFVSTIAQTGGYSLFWTSVPVTTGAFSLDSVSSQFSGATTGAGNRARTLTLDPSQVVPTAAENRPRNIAYNYIVRAI